MNYMTTAEAALKWGITANRVTILAKEGRINGAIRIGYRWLLPEDAQKPQNPKIKPIQASNMEKEPFFRFPSFEGCDTGSFAPPLTHEEIQIKAASEAFHACRFDDSQRLLGKLVDTTQNIYIRIRAIHISCILNIFLNDRDRFFKNYTALAKALNNEFPRKKEMLFLLNELNATMGSGGYFHNNFAIDCDYEYHQSFMSHLSLLCLCSYSFRVNTSTPMIDINPYELLCASYDNKGCFVDSQGMHLYLGIIYSITENFDKMNYHYKQAFTIAQKHELYYQPAMLYYYYGKSFDSVLSEYPDKFVSRITTLSKEIHERFAIFSKSISLCNVYNLLSSEDFFYVLCAVSGYRYKEISKILQISDTTVANRYNAIYDKLGVKNKSELIEYYLNSIKSDGIAQA